MSLAEKSMSLLKRDIFLFCTAIVTGVVVARKLGPEAMGIWAILQMIPAYAECFGRMKVDIAAVYYLGKQKYSFSDVLYNLNALAIGASFLILLVIIIGHGWLYRMLFGKCDIDVTMLMYIMMIQIPAHFLAMNYSYLLIFREDIVRYNRMVVIKALLSSVLGIVLLLVFDLGLFAVVMSSVLSVIVSLIYAMANVRGDGTGTFSVRIVKDLLAYGFKLYIAGIISRFNGYIAQLLVVLYLSPAAVAFFSMAQSRGQLLDKIPAALNTILYPQVSKTDDRDMSATLVARSFRVTLVMLTVAALVALVMIKPMVLILYGREYESMVLPFMIMLPGLVFSGASTVFNQYFMGIGRADITAKVAIPPLIVQVVAALALLPALGMIGASLAFLVGFVTIAVLMVVVFIKLSRCSFMADILPRRDDVRVVHGFLMKKLSSLKTMFTR